VLPLFIIIKKYIYIIRRIEELKGNCY